MTLAQIRTVGITAVIIFILFVNSQDTLAQALPCNNSQTESAIPANDKGESLMPQEIQNKSALLKNLGNARMDRRLIEQCLKNDELFVNHVIDFWEYAAAWRKIRRDHGSQRDIQIRDSVLWSFQDSRVDLTLFAIDTKDEGGRVTHRITAPIRWTNVTVGPSFSAQAVEFLANSVFYGSRFPNQASFRRGKFRNEVSFQGAAFGQNASFQNATFDQDVFFRATTFVGPASFDEATFGARAVFNFSKELRLLLFGFERGARFGPNASFWRATFAGPATFDGVAFGPNASFMGAEFNGIADFVEAVFGPNASFGRAEFAGPVSFDDASFDDKAWFSDAVFGSDTSFRRAEFAGPASFENTSFGNTAWFSDAVFCNGAAFTDAASNGDINFQNAEIKRRLNFSNTKWAGRVNFRNAVLETLFWDSTQDPSIVKGVFDARGATLSNVLFRDVRFPDIVNFSNATIGGIDVPDQREIDKRMMCEGVMSIPATGDRNNIVFENLVFESTADFFRTKFQEDAIFVRNHFPAMWDLTNVTFQKEGTDEKSHLCLSFNRIGKLAMEGKHLYGEEFGTSFWSLFPSPSAEESRIRTVSVEEDGSFLCIGLEGIDEGHERLANVYGTLEKSFREANDKRGEKEAWYLGKVAARESNSLQSQRWVPRWVPWILLDIPSRYGIDLARVCLVSIGIMLLFFFIFWSYLHMLLKRQQVGLVKLAHPPNHTRVLRFRPFEPFMESADKSTRPLRPLKDALLLSGRAFLNLGLGSTYPRMRALIWIANVEWLLGMGMLIHFFIAVKNSLPIALPLLGGSP